MSRDFIDDIFELPDHPSVVAVAIPACNEAASIETCLGALDAAAAEVPSATVQLVVLVNNSTDLTAVIARAFSARATTVHVEDVNLASDHAHAGGARRMALERALARLPHDGILMTTDADSRVHLRWIAANLDELAAGADAVAGVVAFDDLTRASLPPLPMRDLEWKLAQLHARLEHLIHPRGHDPWPKHIWAWGASLALTAAAYRQVGGLPAIPLAEDRALAKAIERGDLRLRHSYRPVVYTSARQQGRAPGGLADLLQSYACDPLTACDAALEQTLTLVRRLCWQARLRRVAEREGPSAAVRLAERLGYRGPPKLRVGALWHSVETHSPVLGRTRVTPDMLAHEIVTAQDLIRRIERRAARRADSDRFARAA